MSPRNVETPITFDWRHALRTWRKRRGLTQQTLAQMAGLSPATVRAYENRARDPSAKALTHMVRALGIPRQEANLILASAGYAVDWQTLLEGRYVFDLDLAQSQLEACVWPAFISDQAINVVATNRLFDLVWDVDLTREYMEPGDRNLLGGASDPHFARLVANFDDLVKFMIGLAKGDPRFEQNPERPAPWLEEPMARFLKGDAQLINRVMKLWESAEPIPHRTRHQYDVHWLHRGQTPMQFRGVLTIGDLWNELSWNDWIPADAETWARLAALGSDRRKSKRHPPRRDLPAP